MHRIAAFAALFLLAGCVGPSHPAAPPPAPDSTPAASPPSIALEGCEGHEHWYPIDVASLAGAVPASYSTAMAPMEVVYVPLVKTTQASARVALAAATCGLLLDNETAGAVKLAWTAVLVTTGPTPMRANGWDFNQYALEWFADGMPNAALAAFRANGWPMQPANITDADGRTVVRVDGKTLYDAAATPDTAIADDNAFQGERHHRQAANGTFAWVDLDGRLDRYVPESSTTLQTAAGVVGGFRQAGFGAPFHGWATYLTFRADLTFGHQPAA